MTKDIRIISYISPYVESKLVNYDLQDLAELFDFASVIYSKLKNLSILILPIELMSVFISDLHLRMFKDLIENDPQSNIIFGKTLLPDCCELDSSTDIFMDYPEAVHSSASIIKCLSEWNYPLLVDIQQNNFKKNECVKCSNLNQCSDQMELISCKVPSHEEFNKCVNQFIESGITHWHINRGSFTSFDLKKLAFLLSLFYDVGEQNIPTQNDYLIHNGLCEDIKSNRGNNFNNIAFSIYRANQFSSSSDPLTNNERFSIDWHRNDPFRLNDYKLYRVDVVGPFKTGLSNSGTDRILYASDGMKKIFLAYTVNHDFSLRLIENRVNSIPDECF